MVSKRLSLNQAKLLKKHRYILQKLASTSEQNRRKILKNAPLDLFKTLNLIFRLLDGNKLNLSTNQTDKIKKHKRLIRSTSKLHGNDIKGKLSQQKGGALASILSAVLPIIGGLIKNIL